MNKAVLKLNLDMRDRLRKRVEFSKSYEELNSKAGSVSAVLYSIFKSALYDYKFTDERGRETDEAVNDFLDLRGIPYHKDSSTKLKSRKYLDYASSEELDVLNEGIRRIRELVVLSNKDFAGFPNVFEDVAKLGRELRGKFYRDTDIQIESYPMQEETIGRIKNAEIKFQKENNTFRVKPKNQKKQTLQNQSIDNTLTNDAINSANKDDKIKTPTKKPALKLNQDMKDRLRNRVEFSMAYKELSSKAGSSTAKLYSIFKSALYDFDFADQSGVEQESKIDEFLQLKGINYNKSLSKQTKARKYLDYASVEELELLVEGLDKIRQTVVLANKNFAGFPNVEQDVARLGRELRNKFYEETGVQVEYYPVQEETIGRVKTAQSRLDKQNLTFRTKAKQKENVVVKKDPTAQDEKKVAYVSNSTIMPKFFRSKD